MRSAFSVASPNVTALRALNYTPEVERFRAKANEKSFKRLGSLLQSLGPGYGSVFTRIDCRPEYGVELLSQADMFATEPSGRVIRRDCIPRPEAHKIERWQILMAGAGTLGENELFGRSIIADERLAGRYVGPHAMAMSFRSPGSNESLYAYGFLCTSVGVRCVRAASYGTKVLGLRSEMLADLPIPWTSEKRVERVAELIKKAVVRREEYADAVRLAKSIIEGLPEAKEANEACKDMRARFISYTDMTFPTLLAWNYASIGNALAILKRKWKGRLADFVPLGRISYGSRFSRVPCTPPYGVDFWSQRDLFLIRPIPRRVQKPNLADEVLFFPNHTIFVSGRGQLQEGNLFGRVELARFGASGSLVTGDAIPLVPRVEYSDFLYTFFSTKLGLHLLRSCAIGTSIPAIHLGLLSQLPIPQLEQEALSQIGDHISTAVTARCAATESENEAIRIIEKEVLPEWLS